MVLNRIGFASGKRYEIQPDYYKNIFNAWNAVYLIGDDEFHICLNPDFYSREHVRDIEILKQTEKCRVPVRQNLKSVKEAVEVIKGIKRKYGE